MKQTIDLHQFREAFQSIRPDNFSYHGLEVLFEYFEELEDDCGVEIELDVIAICCEYCEAPALEIAESYDVDVTGLDDDEIWDIVTDYLQEQGVWCGEAVPTNAESTIVYESF